MDERLGSMAAGNGSAVLAPADERGPGEDQGVIAEDRAEAREGGGGDTSSRYASSVSSCPIWCGQAIDGVVEFCCSECRDWTNHGREL
jgi:hypothetical protein